MCGRESVIEQGRGGRWGGEARATSDTSDGSTEAHPHGSIFIQDLRKSQEVYGEKALNLDHIQSFSMGSRALTESNGTK